MTKNNYTKLIVAGLIGVAAVVVGAALMQTESRQKEQTKSGELAAGLIGQPLPAMQLTDKIGKPYALENLKGKNAVLFFNEGIMCYPACWNQIAAFGTDPRFNSPDTVAMSVVIDSPKDWEKAGEKMPDIAKATILFDQNAQASRQLGLLSAHSSMHAGSMPGHTYLLLDKQGVVREVFDDANMGVNNNLLMDKISEF